MPSHNRSIFYWSLYDFANSLAATVFGIYFSQWLVVDHQVSDLKFNLIFVVSSFLLLLTAPIFGVVVDKLRVKMPFLRVVTVFTFSSLFVLGLLATLAAPTQLVINLVVFLLILGQYFYQFSYVFYNPFLKELGPEDSQAKISGIGDAAGGLGQIIGLVATLPLATGAVYLFGHRDESQVFTPTAILFLLLTLPMLLKFKEAARPAVRVSIDLKKELGGLYRKFLGLGKHAGVHRFLLAYFFFNDAILTAAHNFPIYIQQVFRLPETVKTAILGSIILAVAVGALLSGWLAKRIGQKSLLLSLLALWTIVLPLTAVQTRLPYFTFCMLLIGLLVGATGAISRAVLTYLTPPEELAHAFSYYAMGARLASFIGPFVWGLITYTFIDHGVQRYQIALASMAVFVVIGFLIMRKIPADNSAPVVAA